MKLGTQETLGNNIPKESFKTKDKKISKDFERDYTIEIQELTDKYIKTSEEVVSKKISEISEV